MKPFDDDCESDHELPPEEIMGAPGMVSPEKDIAQVYSEHLAMLSSAPAWEVMNLLPSLVQAQQRACPQLSSLDFDSLKRQISSAPAVLSELELEQLQEVQNAAAMALKAQQLQQAQAQAHAQAQQQLHAQTQAQALYQPMLPQTVFIGVNPYVQHQHQHQHQQLHLQHQHLHHAMHQHVHHGLHHHGGYHKNQKNPPNDKPRMVIDVNPPCKHNQWERISKKKNSISLRCRKCRSCWKTKLEFFEKCSDFYAGHCALGDECPHPHIYSKAAEKHQLIRQQEAAAAAAGDNDGDSPDDDDN